MATEQRRERPDDYFADWKEREALAEGIIPLVGQLYRQNNVKTFIYGRSLVGRSVTNIMKTHRFVRQVEKNELSEFETFPLLQALVELSPGPAHIDIGMLTAEYMNDGDGKSPKEFLKRKLKDILANTEHPLQEPQDIVLFGFGRIGRLMARLLVEKVGGGDSLRLRAIVVRKGGDDDLIKRASLLRRDSVHGSFEGTIRVDEERQSFVANGNEIKVIYASAPDEIDYTKYGIKDAIIVDNTGKWRDDEALGLHLKSKGVKSVILTAPAKGNVPNIVYGINNDVLGPDDRIVSAASCTTNAIVPPLKALNDKFQVLNGHVETVHAYTNDQNLIDNYHKGNRRGRSAPLNMVLTETGAVKAVAKVLPEMAGKLTGNAIRVPTPNVSMAILNLTLGEETSVEEINEYMRDVALHGDLRRQIDFTSSPEVVSTDFVGSRYACIFDAQATIVNGNHVVLYFWYDNEFGYTCQVNRVVEQMAGVKYVSYPSVASA
ncbi:MAG: glyceraldehyde-3-phosphate dehydrogenase [Pseudomonadales bacterium]